jgi:DNA repair protein RadC
MEKHYGIGHIKRLKSRFKEGKTVKSELIELLLSYPIRGRDVKAQSKEIYSRASGNFRKVFEVIKNEKIDGIGPETKDFFILLKGFFDAYSEDAFVNTKFRANTQADIINYFKNLCAGERKESVYIIYLNAKNRITGSSKVCEGTLTQSLLYPREIINGAIEKGALSFVVIHNHPSGDPTPSENDKKITRKLLFATKEMDMNMLDHIVIGTDGKGYYSFYEDGVMEQYNNAYRSVMETVNKI